MPMSPPHHRVLAILPLVMGLLCAAPASAQQGRPTIGPSDFLSPEAKARMAPPPGQPSSPPPSLQTMSITEARALADRANTENLAGWRAIYDLDIRPVMMNGVQTDVVTPKGGVSAENRNRVLINLHGGGFWGGARSGGQAEAAPVAGRGRIKVVAVDYRMAPEFTFPAASEDVEKVYVELLKTYKPQNIGIYGCSAGGALTAQALAWIDSRHLPRPGAAGVFCSGAMPSFWYDGDSASVSWNGAPTVLKGTDAQPGGGRSYLDGADQASPLVTPGLDPAVLARFPPTLLVTGTRDVAMSNALITNMRLLKAGVDTQLLVLEGIGHGQFNALAGTPEAAQTYDIIWRFFDRHLAR